MIWLITSFITGVILGITFQKLINESKVTYTDEVIDKGDRRNPIGGIVGKYFTIKRTYSNGKIEFRMETI